VLLGTFRLEGLGLHTMSCMIGVGVLLRSRACAFIRRVSSTVGEIVSWAAHASI